MSSALFEVSWEVCNKVGGIHTVVSSKARSEVERRGDDYVAIGPMVLGGHGEGGPFEEEQGHEAFKEACRERGVRVRVGRWRTGGRPRTVLVDFSRLFEEKDTVLAGLWEDFGVDSLFGGWDYIEPAMFGHAAGIAIEEWCRCELRPRRVPAVAQFHEWMTGAGLLYLKSREPSIATVFTTHATMLGRSMTGSGRSLDEATAEGAPERLARELGIPAKHSMECVTAREADVFTTVSEITAGEAEVLLGRRPDLLTPNGIDLELIAELSSTPPREEVRGRLARIAAALCGEDLSDAAFLAVSGRYEFHNKGIDVLLDALARMQGGAGRRVVLFVLVPAGASGLRRELRERLAGAPQSGGTPGETAGAPLGFATHELFDSERDPLRAACLRLGLGNQPRDRVHVVHVPAYLPDGPPLDVAYEAALRAVDLSCFPSAYEPWGYTPVESLAVGVPTVTTDLAGFGRFALDLGLEPADGVTVLRREGADDEATVVELARVLEAALAEDRLAERTGEACARTAEHFSWETLARHHEDARDRALAQAAQRAPVVAPAFPLPAREERTEPTCQPRLLRFDVAARLPVELRDLERLARNLWWSWDPDAPELFRAISPVLWESCGHNPVTFLRRAWPRDLQACAADEAWRARYQAVVRRFDEYVSEPARSFEEEGAVLLSSDRPVAYFCFEFGLHESLRIYSGGLGVLAGDHLKSASDLALPLVAVGLFYRGGYLRQLVSPSGEQLHQPLEQDPEDLPLEPVRGADGQPLRVRVNLPSSALWLRAWEVRVGRVRLFLLDADLPENEPEDRAITRRLYAGDSEERLRQEIALGKGGMRLLAALGIQPAVLHLNEGHAGFAALERVSRLVTSEGLTFEEAREVVRGTTAFTTHTPVPAGHDVFSEDLMRRYFGNAPSTLGLPWEPFMDLGRGGGGGGFNMTYLCLALGGFANGVAQRHGEVSRALLHPFWSGLLEEEVPIQHVTNGVHLGTWVGRDLAACLGVEGRPARGEDFARAAEADRGALWAARCRARRALLEAAAASVEAGVRQRQDDPRLLAAVEEGLREDALVIGFARRFAPYKRATLLLSDEERLERLLLDEERPVRLLIAGKAHPADGHGAALLRRVVELSRRSPFLGRVLFLEDYGIDLARRLVQGCDLWLNTPRAPLEASGTSGMKAAANGGLNLSVLDGWWVEGYQEGNGWALDADSVYPDAERQDALDAERLLRLLEDEVVPLFFERDANGVPMGWMERVVLSLRTVPSTFNTDRMVSEYLERAYVPLGRGRLTLARDGYASARERARTARRVREAFQGVRILNARVSDSTSLRTGDVFEAELEVERGALTPDDLRVELVMGRPRGADTLSDPTVVALEPGQDEGSRTTWRGQVTVSASGTYAYGLRVRPTADREGTLAGLVLWA